MASYTLGEPGQRMVLGDPLRNAKELEKILVAHEAQIRVASNDPEPNTSRNAPLLLMSLERSQQDQQRQVALRAPVTDPVPTAADLAALRSADRNQRNAAFLRLSVTVTGRREIIKAAASVTNPDLVAWYRTNSSNLLIPEAIEAINSG